jgi:uncharacterized protein (DUF2141 family)
MFSACLSVHSQNRINIEILGVKRNGGVVYLSVFNSETSYRKKEIFKTREVNPGSTTLSVSLDLPDGEYFFSAYQDSNNNGKCDTNLLGIPKEPVAISKYDGKGIPGGFHDHKVTVGANNSGLQLQLHKL